MQKNLKSKVLLTLLAASVFYLPAYANAAGLKIDDGNATATDSDLSNWNIGTAIYYTKSLQNNTITINNTQYNYNKVSIYGAYDFTPSTANKTETLNSNTVTVNGSTFNYNAEIYGANAYWPSSDNCTATLNSNTVTVNGSTFNNAYIYGAYAFLTGSSQESPSTNNKATLSYNTVTFNDSTFSNSAYIYGAQVYWPGYVNDSTAILTGNSVTIKGNTTFNNRAEIYGAHMQSTTSKNITATFEENSVKIDNGVKFNNSASIHGAYAFMPGNTNDNIKPKFNKNTVTISGADFEKNAEISAAYAFMPGAQNSTATLTGNNVTIDGGTFSSDTKIYGSYAYMDTATNSSATFTGNNVTISDGTFGASTNIYGSSASMNGATNSSATFTGNNVTISGGTFSSDTKIYGAYASLQGSPTDGPKAEFTNNTVTLTGNAGNDDNSLSNVNLYGYGYEPSTVSPSHSGNNLIVDGWSGQVNSVSNFDNINFENIKVEVIDNNNTPNETAWFNIVSKDDSNVADTTVNINSIAAGDYEKETNLGGILDLDTLIADTSKDKYVKIAPKLNAETVYFASDYGTNGVIANKFSEADAYQDTNLIYIYATVEDTVLAGKFIDTDGTAYYNSSQTEDTASLTIDGNLAVKNASVIAGAYAAGDKAATGGEVYVAGDYSGTVYAGYSENKSAAESNNFVYIKEGTKAANLNLLGDNKDSGTSGATLAVTGNGSELGDIGRFDTITFDNAVLDNETAALQVKHADLDGTKLRVNSLAGGNTYSEGQNLSLLNATEGISGTSQIVLSNEIVLAGVAQELTLSPATDDRNSINLTVTKVELAPQTDMVAETHAATAAFVNQGTDLINDSLDVLGRDGSYGVKTFAAVQGNRSTYSVADDLKINGWSVIAGFGAENEHNGGDFAWGVFYENGSGNYRTYNTFNNEFFRGDGSMVYNGGGIAARYENAKGVYTEGSLRAGMLKNEMDNALRDASGASYGYETESTYYGAHIGVGQIFEIDENTDLDVYGKFFHTYVDGDTVTIGGDKFDFDSITSDRLRVGARVTKQQAKVNTYYGLAYEYEFNGDADMTAQGIRAERQSFGGGTGIAELGFNYQPGNDSPWNFDLNLRGYVGERQGGSFNVQATYTF